ncbi:MULTISPECIES: hypothetical protein [Streptomyces]|uniref:Uncharacterized protein n=2 Tax=Streptomyces TaxID=1883 RepID=A0ABV9IWS7_9ACTN
MQQRTNKQILGTTREMVTAMVAHVQGGESRYPAVRELVPYLLAGVKRVPDGIVPSTPEDRREMSAMARDAAIHALWRVDKAVLAMDEYLLAALSESPAELPASAVRGLQYRNPLIVLGAPDFSDEDTVYYRSHLGIPLVAYLFGRWDHGQLLCSMNDDRFEDLGVMFAGFIATPEGLVFQTLRCTVPLGRDSTTIADAVARTVAGFHFSSDMGETDISRLASWLRRYLTQVLHTLSYAGSNKDDAEVYRLATRSAGKGKKARRSRPDEVTEFVKLGGRLSRELRELRSEG